MRRKEARRHHRVPAAKGFNRPQRRRHRQELRPRQGRKDARTKEKPKPDRGSPGGAHILIVGDKGLASFWRAKSTSRSRDDRGEGPQHHRLLLDLVRQPAARPRLRQEPARQLQLADVYCWPQSDRQCGTTPTSGTGALHMPSSTALTAREGWPHHHPTLHKEMTSRPVRRVRRRRRTFRDNGNSAPDHAERSTSPSASNRQKGPESRSTIVCSRDAAGPVRLHARGRATRTTSWSPRPAAAPREIGNISSASTAPAPACRFHRPLDGDSMAPANTAPRRHRCPEGREGRR